MRPLPSKKAEKRKPVLPDDLEKRLSGKQNLGVLGKLTDKVFSKLKGSK